MKLSGLKHLANLPDNGDGIDRVKRECVLNRPCESKES